MIISLIFFIVILLPISLRSYRNVKGLLLYKILNSGITLYLILLISPMLRRSTLSLFNSEYYLLLEFSSLINLVYSIISILVFTYTISLTIGLSGGRTKARRSIFWILPIVALLTNIYMYFARIELSSVDLNLSVQELVGPHSIPVFMFICFMLFYRLKKTKTLLNVNN